MNRTVGEHIRELESHRQRLSEEMTANGIDAARLNDIDADIRAINLAISYFRAALDTEQQVK
jgi:hypothetical protein